MVINQASLSYAATYRNGLYSLILPPILCVSPPDGILPDGYHTRWTQWLAHHRLLRAGTPDRSRRYVNHELNVHIAIAKTSHKPNTVNRKPDNRLCIPELTY